MTNRDLKNITIVGDNGETGIGIAQVFAASGRNVVIKTRNVASCTSIQVMSTQLDRQIREGQMDANEKDSILDRLSVTADNIEAYSEADLILELGSEDMEIKHATFREMELYAKPECILASGTSVESITEIAEAIDKKERVIGIHFWKQESLAPLVEVIRTELSSDVVVNSAMALLEECGKRPAECKKDIPGFLVSRLQHALLQEAVYMAEQGIADMETINYCISSVFGLDISQLTTNENIQLHPVA